MTGINNTPTDFGDAVYDGIAIACEPRTEFGILRSTCACNACKLNCQFMPGFLIPADLTRMIPADADPFEWAERNLLASPGALVACDGSVFRIPTLVPAVKQDGSCINLTADGRCGIHAVSPFGCAFFSCASEENDSLSRKGLAAIMLDELRPGGMYRKIWQHLYDAGKTQCGPEVSRARMAQYIEKEGA